MEWGRYRIVSKTLAVAAVMVGITLPLRIFSVPSFISTPLAAALGGAIGIKYLGVRWQQSLVAAVIFAVALAFPTIVEHVTYQRSLASVPALALSHMIEALVGAALLPGLDATARRFGPAPRLWTVALVAVIITLTIAGIEFAFVRAGRWGWPGYSMFGLGTLVVCGLAGLVLLGAGLILALAGANAQGAWARALGYALGLAAVLFWIANGARWFP